MQRLHRWRRRMISDKLFTHAFAYKKTKLWEKISDMHVFAVELPWNRVGYISIMGAAREHCALALYIGESGFNSLRKLAEASGFGYWRMEFGEHMIQQECLQCAFVKKDELSEGEREEAKAYALSNGIRIAGKNAYPRFGKYLPNHIPWHLQTEQEQEDLCSALEAAVGLAKMLEEKNWKELGLDFLNEDTTEVLLLKGRDGEYTLGTAVLPESKSTEWPRPKCRNDIAAANMKKIKQEGIWECSLIWVPEPVQEDPEEIPQLPMVLIAVEEEEGYILPVPPILNYEEEADTLLQHFMDSLLEYRFYPREIHVLNEDGRIHAFFEDFCRRMNITLCRKNLLPSAKEAELEFCRGLDGGNEEEQMEEMMQSLLMLNEEQVAQLPELIKDQLRNILDNQAFPEEAAELIRKKLFPEETKGPRLVSTRWQQTETEDKCPEVHVESGQEISFATKRKEQEQSFVIKASLGTGCYRHIQISCKSTLFQLHCAILDAFGFMDDHAHAFFMDNKRWSDADSYYAEGIDDFRPRTQRIRLGKAGLRKGKSFKYVFDFGDEWMFQCQVLRIVEEPTPFPKVIRSKGEAPMQYPDYEEDWDEDWEGEPDPEPEGE